jgi:hypothetical protein
MNNLPAVLEESAKLEADKIFFLNECLKVSI